MIWYLKLIRFPNLLMVLLTMVLTKYAIINSFTSAISDVQFILLTISILCITASGYIINDVFDVEADKINKPNKVFVGTTISKKNALLFYSVLSILGLTLGVYAAYLKGTISYSIFFIGTIILLYWYSKSLKRIAIIGNIVTAFLVALTIFIVFVFEVKNANTASNILEAIANFFASISVTIAVFVYIIFAFFMTLIREIIKDIEDIKGDYALKMKTLPILIGINRTKNVVLVISSVVFLFMLLLLKEELLHIPLLLWYTILFIILPFVWFLYKLFSAKTARDFLLLSKLVKVIMFFGILSMVLLKF
ncbi:geranylgeranylglycerol-phosphate geranylgeranyltransferase [Polaribacter uvawellassae]|uniref:geranylgeranylglycerol-phosphate geranylgeranyltransferase n=1 Tax=Polaribacter uvawellassae TaxID=3133495 RepID=UPI00321AD2DF